MRLRINHLTHYRFDEPAKHSIQYLRLTPRPDPSQVIRSWSVSTPGKLSTWTDGFGNLNHVSVQDGLHEEVRIAVSGEVQTVDTFGVLPADDGLPPLMFLRETRYTAVDEDIRAFAAPFAERVLEEGIIAALHALMWMQQQTIEHQPGVTDIETTAAEALRNRHGVCQDQTHLFIACCRVLGVPSRYVSGYMVNQDGQHQNLATHAWAEAHVPDLGWVSFDVTNGICATDAYVRLAVGLDYDSACPIRGLRRGGGVEDMAVQVQVIPDA